MLVEPIQGEAGVVVPSSDYLGALRQLCTERDVLLMVDEIQTGLGRTGRWFAFQHLGIEPDVVTMAKALGNGMPVGACWARAEVAAAFVPGDHGSTFGGQPLAMSAARATLAVMEAERRARAGPPPPGPACAPAWRACPGWPRCGARACCWPPCWSTTSPAPACAEALQGGLVINAPRPDVLRFAPSLLVSDADIDRARRPPCRASWPGCWPPSAPGTRPATGPEETARG